MIKRYGGVFGRNPTFKDVTVEGDLSLTGDLIIDGETVKPLDYQGTWDADANSPEITGGSGVTGQIYIVSTGGSTSIDGISNWGVGDWIVYNGSAWQRVEGGADGNFVNLSVSGDITVDGTVDGIDVSAIPDTYVDVAGDTMTGNLSFGDNDKAVFGAGSDLQIFHNGSNSVIRDTGTGDLVLDGANIRFSNVSGEYYAYFTSNAETSLYYNNAIKLSTTETGIDVTGTVTADGLTVTAPNGQDLGDIVVTRTSTGTYPVGISMLDSLGVRGVRIEGSLNSIKYLAGSDGTTNYSGNAYHQFYGGSTLRMQVDGGTGDISFYEDTGTTAKFFWDASAESLGIGTSSPSTYAGGATLGILKSGGARIGFSSSSRPFVIRGDSGSDDIRITARGSNDTVDIDLMTIDVNGYVGIGTTNPQGDLDVVGEEYIRAGSDGVAGAGGVLWLTHGTQSSVRSAKIEAQTTGNNDNALAFYTNANFASPAERMRIDSDGNVGIGTISPQYKLEVAESTGSASANITNPAVISIRDDDDYTGGSADTTNNWGKLVFHSDDSSSPGARVQAQIGAMYDNIYANTSALTFGTASTSPSVVERMRIDSSGNLLVGKTSASSSIAGTQIEPAGAIAVTRSSASSLYLNRLTTDGDIVQFRKDGTTVGSIGVDSGDNLYIGSLTAAHAGFYLSSTRAAPFVGGFVADNIMDLGTLLNRFDDIYATNGTIQTSDEREKQDIDVLSDAEHNVAVAAKGLIRKFRWKDAVAEKGDDARIHFGVIAQDLKAAFEAEGLDAGRYAMFIHSEWWETYTDVPAVEAVEAQEAVYDDEGNLVSEAVEAVEAKEAYTRTDTFDTEAEAPEGAVKKDRMGVRYPELLAFIIGAM